MNIDVFVVLLSSGLLVLLVLAAVHFRRARTATPAYGAKRRNDARLSLSLAVVVAGSLLLGILQQVSVNPQTVGWPTSWGLILICVGLWVVGAIGTIRYLLRMYRIEAQIEAEGNTHSPQE